MKKAPTIIPIKIRNLIAQKPFCIDDLGSRLDLTPIKSIAKSKKNMTAPNSTRYTDS